MKARRQEALAHARDAVVHGGYLEYGPLSTRALGGLLADQTPLVRLDEPDGLSRISCMSGLLLE